MADHPINLAAPPPHTFNQDADILDDDDDDDETFDPDDDDSVSSAAADPPPPPSSAAEVTIAVPGLPDPQSILQQQPAETVAAVAKRPMPPDESRKLFQRLWTDEDEIELLQGFLDYTTHRGGPHGTSSQQHHHDTTAFYDQIKCKFQLDFNKSQLVEKLRRLKKKYRNVVNRFGSGGGKDYTFKSPHDQATFEISSKIWGAPAANAFPAIAPGPVEEDDDDHLNNPNFADCQSPIVNGIDINSKTAKARKRSRAGVVKVEDRQLNAPTNINATQPSAVTTPMAAPTMGGMGIAGSMSSVIEETVKSCLSPVFKELLSSLMTNSNQNPYGPCYGHGLELARSPLPLCFGAAMGGGGGDKVSSNRWRKQQILELEVFSKRLELVQDQIREQLEELRSVDNN